MNNMPPVRAANANALQVKGSMSLEIWVTLLCLDVRLSRRRSTIVMVPTTVVMQRTWQDSIQGKPATATHWAKSVS